MGTEPVELRRCDDVDAFGEAALDYLLRREAEHNLILGICEHIRAGLHPDPYLAVACRGEEVVGAALRTPPHGLVLSHLADPAAVTLVADDTLERYGELPGVLAAREDAARFARAWTERTSVAAELAMRQRIYVAEAIEPPRRSRGELREATGADRDRLAGWVQAFGEEAGMPVSDPEALVDRLLSADGPEQVVIWWADGPVSMAAATGPTPNGIRVNAVYTPPEHRNHGYASACVAALSQRLLSAGRRFCFLYTDLSNPTSNAIYARVGYRPVVDVDQWRFGRARAAATSNPASRGTGAGRRR